MGVEVILCGMIVLGFIIMGAAFFTKEKDMDELSFFGAADLFAWIYQLLFNTSDIFAKRFLIFSLGLVWSGVFIAVLILGLY
ncbi:hypothetical protein JSY36_05820 [Bacillus sp. H-16]|uniref:hypothetical protein n=1 Tax=Alteribacter salitolerans TaxID=2912333 RepID=UPI001964CCE7|nr:hypothetical protein [Alteribacter salitolerans]MBM7095267.1 hypothetical protein [Alteribacter salitolerans]